MPALLMCRPDCGWARGCSTCRASAARWSPSCRRCLTRRTWRCTSRCAPAAGVATAPGTDAAPPWSAVLLRQWHIPGLCGTIPWHLADLSRTCRLRSPPQSCAPTCGWRPRLTTRSRCVVHVRRAGRLSQLRRYSLHCANATHAAQAGLTWSKSRHLADPTALHRLQVYLMMDLLQPIQYARAECCAWPAMFDAAEVGLLALERCRVSTRNHDVPEDP